MINSKRNTYNYFVIAISFLITSSLYSQNHRKIDSLIKATSTEIYVNPDKAIKTGEHIVAISDKDIDSKIKGYKLVADGYSSKRDYEKSLKYVLKANELLHLTNNKLLKIVILNKMGIQYHQLKIYDKSIQYLDQAEQSIMEYPYKDSIHTDLGKNYVIRGFIYKEKFSCDIAIDFFNRGISELLKSKVKADNAIISIAKYNKGNCYILMSNNPLASQNFTESIEAAKSINAKSLQSFALKGLAQVYTLEGKYKDAITVLKEAIVLSTDVNDLILNNELYNGLSQNYLAVNEWDSFKEYHLKHINSEKLIKKRERTSVSVSLDVKEKELTNKVANETSKFYSIILALVVLLLVLLLLFYSSIKKKSKEIVMIKKQIFLLQNEKSK